MKKIEVWKALVSREQKALASKYGLTLINDGQLLNEEELEKLPDLVLGVKVEVKEEQKKVIDKTKVKRKKPVKKTVRRYTKKTK